MLFHIIKIPKNSSKSPQWMLPGHIFLLTQHGEVSPCCGRRTMGSVGQNPRGSSQGSILAFPLHLLASGVIPPTHPKQNHLLLSLSTSAAPASWCVFVFFFPFWMLGFPCCSKQAAAPALAGRQERSWQRLCSHEQFCLTSGGRGFTCQRTAGLGQSSPFIVTFEVLLKLERDDRTDVKLSFS